MMEQQLWVGYYQLNYLDQPQRRYFGHLIGFALHRDDFQQKVEQYKTTHQCALISQLAPLPAMTWFQRHGQQASIFNLAQQLKTEELHFLLAQEENQTHHETNYLIEESLTVAPFIGQPPIKKGLFSYLPEKLAAHPFFAHLTSAHNPKEGLCYPNLDFTENPQDWRYYAVIDGVKSFTLPQLSEHEGKTDSLYQGELKDKMDSNAPFLTQLTVTDREDSPFVALLFTQAEQPWMGAWDGNPTIFIRSPQPFESLAYHLRKFIHLYRVETEKWYFFRFYDPIILVAYLRYIARSPAKLASFFGIRDGQAMIDAFGARIGNRFHIFSLKDLPPDTQPSAVGFDDEFQAFLEDYDKRQLLEKLQKDIIPAEFFNLNLAISHQNIEQHFERALRLGFKHNDALIHLVKAQIYLNNDRTFEQLIQQANNEIGEHFPIVVAQTVYEQAKQIFIKEPK
ncbi:DUF4123 domain-containing protein [Rodentibacter pneumotropicus]|uniref:DUF4123 domain-containing protein n=1 Tax=Rodentibacter pneumotropicus TaxID=758 RepID=UPI0009874F15|nr:DUF4123 domain-containing protein [Rodentibacter pneumotropicus]THA19262.1 DUF4123 domain-containing protein [Rodentibacter pneumotropicus]